ncbi:pyridoxal 5'-phosphate synthase [Mycobacterium sp. 852002-40037_SCH5390672]|uniref:pyridoxal 5'-phosphate synthase n=1 Tax=Mycobacterium sp. 852002-40037_SCH5390672 TaxID=1834089 RepID=UPI000805BC3D|nr:pyridoxal 5'-phosphate synthase [Mycobacterium sp. 852002-40037_SCH5390672]OBB89969.1 phenazine biosynthesis protein [Mycobacterium sp. 852002-40037_SCH5390672]
MGASAFESLTGASDTPFPHYDSPTDSPFPVLEDWLGTAERCGVREPRALALATLDANQRPCVRMVTVIEIDERGLAFASHSTSHKGQQLAANPWAAGVLYWRETGQQIAVSGSVSMMGAAESDAIWHSRPKALQPMSVVSFQSEVLEDPEHLRRLASSAEGQQFPRPQRFVGYRLGWSVVEFWCASSDRMHRRLRYEQFGDGWTWVRLQP